MITMLPSPNPEAHSSPQGKYNQLLPKMPACNYARKKQIYFFIFNLLLRLLHYNPAASTRKPAQKLDKTKLPYHTIPYQPAVVA